MSAPDDHAQVRQGRARCGQHPRRYAADPRPVLATGKPALADLQNTFAIITEYNNRTLGFLVRSVERIVNMNWEEILPPQAGRDHYTAVTRVDNRLVEIIDVEKVLAEVAPISDGFAECGGCRDPGQGAFVSGTGRR